jgi:hypothetical protein
VSQQLCISKSGLYFGAKSAPCEGRIFRIPDFWCYHESGDLACYICERHLRDYGATGNDKSYLYRRLHEAVVNIQIESVPQ